MRTLVDSLRTSYKWGMAFNIKRNEINHSPQWYDERGCDEDSPPSIRGLLLADMSQVDANIEKNMTTGEMLEDYREAWDEVMKGGPPLPAGMIEALDDESSKDFIPPGCYEYPPYTTLGEVMDQHDLDEDAVRGYLKWRKRLRLTEELRAKAQEEKEAKAKLPHKWFTSENDPDESSNLNV